MIVILTVLAALSVWELLFQDAGRVFLIGENLCAGAQKRATFCLLSYADSRSDKDLQCFRTEIDVVVGDMEARRELDTRRQTRSIIADGLVRGRNRPQDVSTAILFYNLAPWLPEVEKAVQLWRDSDPYIVRLVAIADELQQARTPAETQRLKQEVLEIDPALSSLERDFATHLNYGMHSLALCLGVAQGLAACFLILIAVMVSRRITAAREATQEQVHLLAYSDPLTGLANRTRHHARLTQDLLTAQAAHKKVAVLFLDLDRFKIVNDSLGHAVGDELLREVAERLKQHVRAQDTIARIGGDEFLITLASLENVNEATAVADRILRAMAPDFALSNRVPVSVTGSIGISLFPEHGTDAQTLIMNADAAMYRAKESGRNRYRLFVDEMNAGVLEKLTLENNLHMALENQELYLAYQPQVDLATETITAVEALARWKHPRLGLIPPARFIPLAESSGLILPIGEWVLRSACAEARRWQALGSAPIPVAVNVSAVQFRQDGFCDLVRRVLEETMLPPHLLEIEVTESMLLSDEKVTSQTLDELRSMGLKLTIDDFGTGYASLVYLRHFAVDKLKIDRSFIGDVTDDSDDAAITSAIISMAKKLNLKVVAEGVETPEQVSFLRAQGCEEAQGFYFSRPLVGEKLLGMLTGFATHGRQNAVAMTARAEETPA
jgi:diguanylate cyclase (GGDEF)-like protein